MSGLQAELNQYRSDLEAEGYAVRVSAGDYTRPEEIRTLLQQAQPDGLAGAVLVGDLPMAQFNFRENLHKSYWHDFSTPLYYMDLDGQWGGADRGVYTTHTGKVDAEIWLGLIRAGQLPAAGDELTLLKKYFDKVHRYRTGELYQPPFRAFRFYHTIRPDYENLEAIYTDILDPGCQTTADQLKDILNDPAGYQFGVINTASGYSVHHFHQQPCWPLSEAYWTTTHTAGSTDANCPNVPISCSGSCDVDFADVQQANPRILFYHLATSETGRLSQPDNLGGHYIFGTDYGLVALAATQHFITGASAYEHLASGLPFGEAFRLDINRFQARMAAGELVQTPWCPDWHLPSQPGPISRGFYAAVLIGDPTLRLHTAGPADTQPPVISNLGAGEIYSRAASISWQTDEPADALVEYGPDQSYGLRAGPRFQRMTAQRIRLRKLQPSTTYHYRVRAMDAAGNVSWSADNRFTTPAFTNFVKRINAGSSQRYTDIAGRSWSADQAFVGSGWGYVGGNAYASGDTIASTEDDPLFRSERWGMAAYRFEVPEDGTYNVELHFAEIVYREPGLRLFGVAIEGQNVLDRLDIYERVGHKRALTFHFAVDVRDGVLDIDFSKAEDEPKVSAIQVSSLPADAYRIEGSVRYAASAAPVRSAFVQLRGSTLGNQVSDRRGAYVVGPLPGAGSYILQPGKAADYAPETITSYDAALAAQIASGVRSPSATEARAADVDQDGMITARDAALICRKAIGSPAGSATGQAGRWRFFPEALTFAPLTASQNAQDFEAVLLGDLDGNWTGSPAQPQPPVPAGAIHFTGDAFVRRADGTLITRIQFDGTSQPIAFDLDLGYATEQLEFLEAQAVVAGWQLCVNSSEASRLRLGLYAAQPLQTQAVLAEIRWREKQPQGRTGLTLQVFRILVNGREGPGIVTAVSGPRVPPRDGVLLHNFPNPFNPETRITYRVPARPGGRHASLRIYDISGRLIAQLAAGRLPAGEQSIVWDGRDASGRRVASGVYVVRLIAGGEVYSRKILLQK